jgi:tetratricopeptide (TPR) repeat protein
MALNRAGCAGVLAVSLVGVSAHAQPTARFSDVTGTTAPPSPPARAASVPVPIIAPRAFESGSWATQRARALSNRARRYADRGDVALAMSAYNEAIQTDATFGTAFLGLAELREAMSDYPEAEKLYELAAHLPDSAAEARARRAAMYKRLGRRDEALRELEAAVRLDPTSRARQRELAAWYVEMRAWPAALALYRQLLSTLESGGASDADVAAARVQVQALTLLAADADPAVSGKAHPSWVRRTLARVAGRALRSGVRPLTRHRPRQLAP